MIPTYQIHGDEKGNGIKAKIDILNLSRNLRCRLLEIYLINHISTSLDIDFKSVKKVIDDFNINHYTNVPINEDNNVRLYSILFDANEGNNSNRYSAYRDSIIDNLLTLMVEEIVTLMYCSEDIHPDSIDKNKVIQVVKDFYYEYCDYNFDFQVKE